MNSYVHMPNPPCQWLRGNLNPLSDNPIKWSTTLKQFIGKLPTICLSVFDHFVGSTLKGLSINRIGQKEFFQQGGVASESGKLLLTQWQIKITCSGLHQVIHPLVL